MMAIDRVMFSKTFQIGTSIWEKIGMEASLVPDIDNPQECLEKLKQEIESFHRKSNPSLYPKGNEPIVSTFIPEVQVEKKDSAQRIIEQINQCSDKTVLESFKLLAKSNPEIQKAYDNKLEQFQV